MSGSRFGACAKLPGFLRRFLRELIRRNRVWCIERRRRYWNVEPYFGRRKSKVVKPDCGFSKIARSKDDFHDRSEVRGARVWYRCKRQLTRHNSLPSPGLPGYV